MRLEVMSRWSRGNSTRKFTRVGASARTFALCLLTAGAFTASAFHASAAPAGDEDENSDPVRYDQKVYPQIPTSDKCHCVDMMIGDCGADIGDEPNTACGGVFWNSNNIWVRNQTDGFANHTNQYPIAGQDNWVYVALHNRGFQTLTSGNVNLYFAKASTGLYWPASWISNVLPTPCGTPPTAVYGNQISVAQTIVSVAAGTDVIVRFKWDAASVPNPADYCNSDAHHFCLLARFISPEDPMTYIEGTGVVYNTQYNNNIAWKNEMIMDAQNTHGPIDVHNGSDADRNVTLAFDVPREETQDPIFNHATIQIDLGQDLKAQWQANGNQGKNIVDAGGNLVQLTADGATIEGLTLSKGATANLTVDVVFPTPADPTVAGNVYHLNMGQLDDANTPGTIDNVVGGETVTITMPNADGGRNIRGNNQNAAGVPANNSLAQALQLTVHPNPTRGAATITYTLPADMPVTIGIYDVNGNLVRTLVSGVQQHAGTHTLDWNGTTADDKAVASGTYFYRIETPRGSAEQKLGIAR